MAIDAEQELDSPDPKLVSPNIEDSGCEGRAFEAWKYCVVGVGSRGLLQPTPGVNWKMRHEEILVAVFSCETLYFGH